LKIVLRYRDSSSDGDVTALVSASTDTLKGHYDAPVLIDDYCAVGEVVGGSGQDTLVLVSNVEAVEVEKAMLASGEGLDFVTDEVNDFGAGAVSGFYVSLNGSLLRLPVFGEGKAREFSGGVPIGFNEDTVSVIKGGPEVMQGVSEHCGKVFRDWGASDGPSLFQRALLIIDRESFNVVRDEAGEHRFKLIDVLLGPFYLQPRAIKI